MSLIALRDDVPLPVAQLIGRAANAKSILERFQCTFYVGEVALKLAATVRTVRALAADPAPDKVAAGVAKLVRASLGHWQELVREGDRALGGLTGGALDAQPLGPATGRMLDAMVAAELLAADAAKAARKTGALGLLDALVTFRNKVVGHGAARVPSFYQEWTPRLGDALAELLALPALFGGHQLVIADRTEEGEPRYRLLRGPSPLPWDGSGLGGEGLWLVTPGGSVPATPFLHHLSDDDLLRDRVTFVQEVRAQTRGGSLEVKRLEYLDYFTGETVEAEGSARAAMAGLLSRVGAASSVTQVDEGPPPPRLEVGGSLGGFDLVERIGRGGQGEVWCARQRGMDRLVALKMLRPEVSGDDHVRKRFEREVRALVRSDHPNVVKVFVSGEQAGIHYYAMEYIDGKDLAHSPDLLARLRDRPALPDDVSADPGSALDHVAVAAAKEPAIPGEDPAWRRLAALFAGAAEGVAHLHDRGIVHRDLKPANLMLTRDAARLVVTDLGLARLADASAMTRDTGLLGTLRSMAPEQLDGGPAAARPAVDVFGLGVALFETATGRPMRDGATEAAVIAQIIERPPRADKVAPEVPRGLADVIAKALDPSPAARYPTARAFADALRGDLGAISRPGSRGVLIGVAVAGLAVLGGGAFLVIGRGGGGGPAKAAPDARVALPADARVIADVPAGMVRIPGATVDLGSTPKEIADTTAGCKAVGDQAYCDDAPRRYRRETLRPGVVAATFDLDAREVTRGELVTWLNTAGVDPAAIHLKDTGLSLVNGVFMVDGDGQLPASGITWAGADAYCRAQGKRLPTEDEWELAARGAERRIYPWGDPPPTCETAAWGRWSDVPQHCEPMGPSDVGTEAGDVTPEGVRDLGGNVAEWTSAEIVDPACPTSDHRCKVAKGGQFRAHRDLLRSAARMPITTEETFDDIGLRCARSLSP